MKYLILFVNAFFAVTLAQKLADNVDSKYRHIPIVAQENVVEHDGSFNYGYEGGDGTKAQQSGQLKYVDPQNAGEAVQGGYSYQVRPFIVQKKFVNCVT